MSDHHHHHHHDGECCDHDHEHDHEHHHHHDGECCDHDHEHEHDHDGCGCGHDHGEAPPRQNFSYFYLTDEQMEKLKNSRIERQARPFDTFYRYEQMNAENVPASARRQISIIPWAPENCEYPDIEPFYVDVTPMDTMLFVMLRVEQKIRMPVQIFVLFTEDNLEHVEPGMMPSTYGIFDENAQNKRFYMVMCQRDDIEGVYAKIDEKERALEAVETAAREARSWRTEAQAANASDDQWKQYIQERINVEDEAEDYTKLDPAERRMLRSIIKGIRTNAAEYLEKSNKFKSNFQSDEQRAAFLAKLKDGIYPFNVESDGAFEYSTMVRVYSPLAHLTGNFVDLWFQFYHKTRYTSVQSYTSLIATSGSIKDEDYSPVKLSQIREKGSFRVPESICHIYLNGKGREKRTFAESARLESLRDVLFGEQDNEKSIKMSTQRFAFFLCVAAGMQSVELEDVETDFFGDGLLSSVRKMIKRLYSADAQSDVEDDPDKVLSEEEGDDNEEEGEGEGEEDEEGVPGDFQISPEMAQRIMAQMQQGGGGGMPQCPMQ